VLVKTEMFICSKFLNGWYAGLPATKYRIIELNVGDGLKAIAKVNGYLILEE
jgi:hypothetical protein